VAVLNLQKVVQKRFLLSLFLAVCFFSFTVFQKTEAQTDGWFDRYRYTDTISQGCALYHQHNHSGAISASATLISSTGSARLTFLWQAPWLYVNIDNLDSKTIEVTWEDVFYVV
jgi:hypothetical protein